jgi:hypothetical protein
VAHLSDRMRALAARRDVAAELTCAELVELAVERQ